MPIRMSGINSGMDIESIVTNLMKSEKIPQDNLKRKKQTLVWKEEAYREVNTKLSSLKNSLNDMKLSGDWKAFKASSSNSNAVSVSASISATPLSHTLNVTSLATAASSSGSALSLTASSTETAITSSTKLSEIQGLSSGGSFTLNGADISYTSEDTISSLLSRVNSSSAGVQMSFDEEGKRFVITSKTAGVGSKVSFDKTDPDTNTTSFLTATGFSEIAANAGKDAAFTLDGISYTRGSNKFTLDGVTYNLQQENTGPVTVAVGQDTDAIFEKVKSFVTNYNSVVELMNTKAKETKYRGFKALLDNEKKDMTETEIKNWETKAKSGVLRSDDILNSTLGSLRSLLSQTVSSSTSNSHNALYKIGLTTTEYDSDNKQNSGKIQLDEDALKAAIEEDPSGIIQLFSNNPDGIAQKMYTEVTSSLTEIVSKAGKVGADTDLITNTLGLEVSNLQEKIDAWDAKLNAKENYYYSMFSKMDSAVGESNSTISYLMSALGS